MTNRTTLIINSCIFAALLAGCVHTYGHKISAPQLDRIRKCVTTEGELVSLIGKPQSSYEEKGYRVLTYEYQKGIPDFKPIESQKIWVWLSKDVVVDFGLVPKGTPDDKCR